MGEIRGKMGALLTNVADHRLSTVPDLTAIVLDLQKTGYSALKVNTSYTRPSSNPGEIGPVPMTDTMHGTASLI